MNEPLDTQSIIAKLDLVKFERLSQHHEAVIAAINYLSKENIEPMANALRMMASQGHIYYGPLEGYVAIGATLSSNNVIVVSNLYPEYTTIVELIGSMVHEVGALSQFNLTEEENDVRCQKAMEWFKQQRDQKPVTSVIQVAAQKNARKVKASLVDVLLQDKIISEEQLNDAKDKQLGAHKPLHDVLVDMGVITEDQLAQVFSKVFDMPVTEVVVDQVDQESLKAMTFDKMCKYSAFPLRIENGTLILAMSNPRDFDALDDLHQLIDMPFKPVLVSRSVVAKRLDILDTNDERVNSLVDNLGNIPTVEIINTAEDSAKDLITDMEKKEKPAVAFPHMPAEYQSLLQSESPTVKLVNLILSDAIKVRASDIHIEPREQTIEIRYRIDGDLKNILQVPMKFHVKVVARVKILATLDITQNMMPQDGRIQLMVENRKVDFRVSTIPTFYGEKIVIRILDAAAAKTDMTTLGFNAIEREMFEEAVKSPQGMVLVTGPTGSGKTSTLYAALNFVKGESTNIVTIEDPIEFLNEGINQIQVNPTRGVTFASGLRSILRQDPNVILIGEIRDKETAEIALKASITGHLLLSTLHTNSCIATITRLADIGIDYFQIASALLLVVSQRLVKTICADCRMEYDPEEDYKKRFADEIEQFKIVKFYKGKGCSKCNFSGYKGRTAVFEVLKVTESMKNVIAKGGFEEEILKEARKNNFKRLIEVGIGKVIDGITTLDEIVKHVGNLEKDVVDITPQAVTNAIEQQPINPPKDPNRKRRILLVDDEEDIRKIVAKYLQMGGHEVIHAVNGQDGVEKACREKPDLIITDLMMPVMDGVEEVKVLRSRLETAVVPIIMLTAKQDKESELAGISAGADDYISKPFDKDKLLARVNMLLRRGSLSNG